MNDMLLDANIDSNMVIVNDNNDIDREVSKHKPKFVIIEALWVIPSKFSILTQLHKDVTCIIRLHSELPFLANEGMALDWIGDYAGFNNVVIAANAPRALKDVIFFVKQKYALSDKDVKNKVIYLPNFYPQEFKNKILDKSKDTVDVACFGAIRPLKNHIVQALAAVKSADKIGKKLRFHINSGRIEMNGGPIVRNLQSMFMHLNKHGHELVNHEWTPIEEFLELCGLMDIGMQCSFSETFNIVAADLISQGVPVVGSSEIPWINNLFCGKPVETNEIYRAMLLTYILPKINVRSNQIFLKSYTDKTRKIWIEFFKK